MTEIHSLSHTTWNCKCHVVFAPSTEGRLFYGEKRQEIRAIIENIMQVERSEYTGSRSMP